MYSKIIAILESSSYRSSKLTHGSFESFTPNFCVSFTISFFKHVFCFCELIFLTKVVLFTFACFVPVFFFH